MSVPMAIALSGQPLLGIPVMVKPSEAEKNLVQSTAAAAGGPGGSIGPYSGGARRLYVGNLHTNLTTEQLKKVKSISKYAIHIMCLMRDSFDLFYRRFGYSTEEAHVLSEINFWFIIAVSDL